MCLQPCGGLCRRPLGRRAEFGVTANGRGCFESRRSFRVSEFGSVVCARSPAAAGWSCWFQLLPPQHIPTCEKGNDTSVGSLPFHNHEDVSRQAVRACLNDLRAVGLAEFVLADIFTAKR
ncbi:hypothetical protein N658DRAFT_341086 [Parathielavia hyrcaniae]|uniref:Uncharacterized protein n=1 Tax=Parathielavia hyrcaniae TaxID=113614 RepID=A0AAN6Q7U2_9PEZI|nr:hypothetical protein N658DRAFT_341086 [Parathielavia hyrcaniae]